MTCGTVKFVCVGYPKKQTVKMGLPEQPKNSFSEGMKKFLIIKLVVLTVIVFGMHRKRVLTNKF